MSTTIRIRPEDKERLERLQERWHRIRGERITHLDLVGHILAYLERSGDQAINDIGWTPLTPEEFAAFEAWFVRDDLPPTDSREIDRVLYGDPDG